MRSDSTPAGRSLPTRRTFLAALIAPVGVWAGSDSEISTAVKAMEARDGLTLLTHEDVLFHRWRGARNEFPGVVLSWPAVAPEGLAICWQDTPRHPEDPSLIVNSVSDGIRRLRLEGRIPNILGISSGPGIIVAADGRGRSRGPSVLIALDPRSGAVQDLAQLATHVSPADIYDLSVSGPGTLVAIGSLKQIQVLDLSGGSTVYSGPGWMPRLSPDGKKLAFVNEDRLYIRSLVEGTTAELLSGTRVKGVGGWSPDGRFLLAGAWTKRVALEKRQIVLDASTGHYAAIGTLGEGDYGAYPRWISQKLMTRWELRGQPCAGINRHVVGDARALQERSSDSILTSSLAWAVARRSAKRRQRH